MAVSSLVQAGHVLHPALLVVFGDCCLGNLSSCDDHVVTKGNNASIPVINEHSENMINLMKYAFAKLIKC